MTGQQTAQNVSNLTAGSRVQQTCSPGAEQTVEVVRNHEDGTRVDGWHRRPEGGLGLWEWTHRRLNGRGVMSERIP
jgi:hypothetical protein